MSAMVFKHCGVVKMSRHHGVGPWVSVLLTLIPAKLVLPRVGDEGTFVQLLPWVLDHLLEEGEEAGGQENRMPGGQEEQRTGGI